MNHREELEALVELAEAGNMRRAADALGVSQSTLSDCVTRLENTYGSTLFERDRRGSRATVYGDVVVAAARQALQILREAEREIALIKGAASGRLAIGAEPGLIEPFLSDAISRGLREFPSLRYRLQALDSNTLVHEVRARRIDFFLGIRPDVPTGGLTLEEIGVVEAVPFVRCGHPLAGASALKLHEIMSFPVVQGPSSRWFVRRIADEMRLATGAADPRGNAAVIVNDFGVVRALVRQTDAVGFTAEAMLDGDFERRAFAPLVVHESQRDLLRLSILIATLEGRSLPPPALMLIETLREVVRRWAGTHAAF